MAEWSKAAACKAVGRKPRAGPNPAPVSSIRPSGEIGRHATLSGWRPQPAIARSIRASDTTKRQVGASGRRSCLKSDRAFAHPGSNPGPGTKRMRPPGGSGRRTCLKRRHRKVSEFEPLGGHHRFARRQAHTDERSIDNREAAGSNPAPATSISPRGQIPAKSPRSDRGVAKAYWAFDSPRGDQARASMSRSSSGRAPL